uniref:HAMP domain-containing protein n=1 Tax=Polaromonas sp. TaxID=1869339 RepID=UPI002FC6C51C
MKTVLYPAIALMNRLSFGMKFSLISVLFFLPMLVTNFYLVRDSYRQFVSTRAALESLDLLGDALSLRRELESFADLVQINEMVGQSGQAGDLSSRIAQQHSALDGALRALMPVSGEAEQIAEFNTKRDEMIGGLQALQQETSLRGKTAMAKKLLGNSQVFIKLVASQAGLSQDRQHEVRQMTELVTVVTPLMTAPLSEGRAIGSYSLGQGFLNSAASTQFDELLLELEKLHAEYGLTLQDALNSSLAARAALESLAAASQATLKDSALLFEDQVVVADTLDAPWPEFFEQVSAVMGRTYAFNDAVLAFLGQQLQARLQENRGQMVLLVAALVLVFLLIGYLYGGFYVSTRTTLKSLGQVMDQVAAGDMTVSFKAQSRDELGELGQVFNATVKKV